jgi:hypothetical protein
MSADIKSEPYMVPVSERSVFVLMDCTEGYEYDYPFCSAIYESPESAPEYLRKELEEFPLVARMVPGCPSRRGRKGRSSTSAKSDGAQCGLPLGHTGFHEVPKHGWTWTD